MTQKELGHLFKEFTSAHLDSMLVRRILASYAAMRGRDTQQAILHHRPNKNKRGIGAAPMKEVTTHPTQGAMVCASNQVLGLRVPQEDRGQGVPGETAHGPARQDQWRHMAPGTQQHGSPWTTTGRCGKYKLGEAPPCPLVTTLADEQELTVADQILQEQRFHIRHEILEHKANLSSNPPAQHTCPPTARGCSGVRMERGRTLPWTDGSYR